MIGCNVTTCPDPKCQATGECIDAAAARQHVKISNRHVPIKHVVEDVFELPMVESPPAAPDFKYVHPFDDAKPHDDEVNPKTLMGARRVDLSLLPAAGIIHGAHAMMDGAVKYNPYNWRDKKVPARTYIAAAMRHLMDFLDGEETAADSGVHHLGHVIGCCAIVLDAMETGNLIDDRPKKGAAPEVLARLEKVILARLAASKAPT